MQIFLGESLRKVSYRLRAAQLHGQIVNKFHFSCVIFVSLAGGLSFVPCLVCASGSVCLLQDRWKPEKGQCLPASADRCQYRGLSSNPKRRAQNFAGCGQGIWGCSMDKEKNPYIFVGLVCVREKYQGQGFWKIVLRQPLHFRYSFNNSASDNVGSKLPWMVGTERVFST